MKSVTFLTLQWKQSKHACLGLLTMFWDFTACSHVSVQVQPDGANALPLPPLPRSFFLMVLFLSFWWSHVALLLAHLAILIFPCPIVHFSPWHSLIAVKCVHSFVDFYLMRLSFLAQLSRACADVRAAKSELALLGINKDEEATLIQK